MPTLVLDTTRVTIPPWVQDLPAYRRWVHSGDFPEKGRICFLRGEVRVDFSTEQLFTHNQVKNEFAFVLTGLAKAGRLGRFIPDGMLLTSIAAGFSVEPDGTFIAKETSGRVSFSAGKDNGCIELEGVPDMVLEVVSTSSVVDVRKGLHFDILHHTSRGYRQGRKQAGWLKSAVFGRSFRLTRQEDELGHPDYSLAMR